MPAYYRRLNLVVWLYALLVLLTGSLSPAMAGDATIFIYHRFDEPRYASTHISGEVFAAQLEFLNREGYQVLPLKTVVDRLSSAQPLPEKCVVLTVDDAFHSFAATGLPALEKYGYPVTLFVSTGSVGRPGYLDWEQLRAIRERGVDIGSHGEEHLHMAEPRNGETPSEWARKIRRDLSRTRADFLRELGSVPDIFAYPYGEYSPELISLVQEAGYRAAVAQQSGVASRYSDLFILPRFPMGGPYATLAGFVDKVKMRGMPIEVLQPQSPVLADQNPPQLEIRFIEPQQLDLSRLNCFVDGQSVCEVKRVSETDPRYRIVAKSELTGRRSKYTLTAPGRRGGWYWFSQLWLNGAVEEGY